MSIVSNLNLIKSYKSDIKQAIIDKGVDMTNIPLSGYASKIGEIETGSDPVLETLNVTDNGTYTAPSGVDGYNVVSVNVPVEGYTEKDLTERTFTIVNLNNTASFVASNAFQNTSTLQTVNLPNCESVGGSAFQSCSSLSRVSLPVCLSVGGYAFRSCSSLSQVSLPNCMSVQEYAFQNCYSLQSIDLPVCSYIGGYAFQNCSSLSLVSLPACEYITGYYVFQNCYSLQSIDLPVCSYISDYAFQNCSSLSQVNIPLCGRIGGNAFGGCSSLKILSLGTNYYGLISYNNANLTSNIQSIYVYEGQYSNYLTATGWSSFADKFVSVGDPTKPLLKFDSETGSLYGYIEQLDLSYKSILSISSSAIKIVDLPECKKLISGDYNTGVFRSCSSLSQVNIPNCENVGANAFYSCYSLQSIDLPVCSYIGANAFCSCYLLSGVNLPVCEYIGNNAFQSCSALQSIDLPVCSYISGNYAFSGCSLLTTINLPACEYIGGYTFYTCSLLQSIDLPVCSYIGTWGFGNCSSLSQVILRSNTVCQVDINVFANTFSAMVYVPASLVDAYKSATNWVSMSSRIFPLYPDLMFSDGLVSGWAKSMNSSYLDELGIVANDVVSVSMSKLNTVASSTFMNHQNMTSVSIPNVGYYPDDTFNGCTSLSEFNIDASSMGNGVFANCTALEIVNIDYEGIVGVGNDIFSNCTSLQSIIVPYGWLESYKVAEGWSQYSSLMSEILPLLSFSNGLVWGGTTTINSTYLQTLGINKDMVYSLSLPELVRVESYGFQEHHYLGSFTLPKCEYIGYNGFIGMGQKLSGSVNVNLPVCSYITSNAFYWTPTLKTLTLGYDGVCEINGRIDGGSGSIESFYVPASLVDAYKTAPYWSSYYANKIFPIPE